MGWCELMLEFGGIGAEIEALRKPCYIFDYFIVGVRLHFGQRDHRSVFDTLLKRADRLPKQARVLGASALSQQRNDLLEFRHFNLDLGHLRVNRILFWVANAPITIKGLVIRVDIHELVVHSS